MTTSRSDQMRHRANRLMQMADLLKAKDSPRAQAIGANLVSAAKLRLLAAKRLDAGQPLTTGRTAPGKPTGRS